MHRRLVIGLVWTALVACPTSAVAQSRYVVLENVDVYAHRSKRSAKLSFRKARPMQLLGKRGGWYEVRTFGDSKLHCTGGATSVRVRFFVRANLVRSKAPTKAHARYRACGRFAGWLRQKRTVTPTTQWVDVDHGKNTRVPVLRGGARLYWANGTGAGKLLDEQRVHSWTRQRGKNRVCAPVEVWGDIGRVKMCVDVGWLVFKLPSELEGTWGGVPVGGRGGSAVPPPPVQPKIVPHQALEHLRIAGTVRIQPPKSVKASMVKRGMGRLIVSIKMCVISRGTVSTVTTMKSSGYPAYDKRIKRVMRSWRYRPFIVNGKPTPVCTSVVFIYNQRP